MRNQQNRFMTAPSLKMSRTKFDLPTFNHKTTFNMGELVPFYIDTDIMPAETDSISTTIVVRMPNAPIKPIMDDLYLDYYYFYDSHRNQWKHFREFMGENITGPWAQETEYTTPQIVCDTHEGTNRVVKMGSPMDYMGINIGVNNISFNAYGMRTYTRVWNWFFRDQNYMEPMPEHDGDEDRALTETNLEVPFAEHCAPVSKFHDYFTSLLPQPQKGEAIMLPLGELAPLTAETAPIEMKSGAVAGSIALDITQNPHATGNIYITGSEGQMRSSDGGTSPIIINNSNAMQVNLENVNVDLTQATASTVNALRLAIQVQKILERDARGGTRLDEVIYSHFGATLPDAQWRPQYLGGKRIPIAINQVIQTSETANTQLGETGSFSITTSHQKDFTKSLVEWGTIIGVLCVRQRHTYQYGMHAMWGRKRRMDYYWPELANVGEQGVKSMELCLTGNAEIDNQIIGFKEAWSEMKSTQSRVSGMFRSDYAETLDIWHLADKFDKANPPTISKEFIEETKENLDRTILVPSTVSHTFIADIAVDVTKVMPMPMYSIPGFMDHY